LTGFFLVRAIFVDPTLWQEFVGAMEIGFGVGGGPRTCEDLSLQVANQYVAKESDV
jgi:hypothetical protein